MTPASLRQRFLALLIDYLVILVYLVCLAGAALVGYGLALGYVPNWISLYGPLGAQAIGFMALTLPVMLYFVTTESLAAGASWGKRVMRIRMRAAKGKRAAWGQVMVRTIVKFLPWELAHGAVYQLMAATQEHQDPAMATILLLAAANVLPLIYICTIVIRRDHRGPHDLIAGTFVVQE